MYDLNAFQSSVNDSKHCQFSINELQALKASFTQLNGFICICKSFRCDSAGIIELAFSGSKRMKKTLSWESNLAKLWIWHWSTKNGHNIPFFLYSYTYSIHAHDISTFYLPKASMLNSYFENTRFHRISYIIFFPWQLEPHLMLFEH